MRRTVPIEELEAAARVPAAEQVTAQAEVRPVVERWDGPQLDPHGDGATGPDGDGE